MDSVSSKKDDPIGAEEVTLQRYITYLSPVASNKPLILKMLQDSDLIAGYNRISSDDEKTQNTLNLFSYGNITDYESDRSKFLPLSDKHLRQLKRLSILTVLENIQTIEVPYSTLQQASQTEDEVQLEQDMCHLIASSVVSGKLSQRKKLFMLRAIHRPRDVMNGNEMLQSLRAMTGRIQESIVELHGAQKTLQDREEEQSTVQETLQKATEEASRAENISAADASSRRQTKRNRGGGNRGGGMPMFTSGQFRFSGDS